MESVMRPITTKRLCPMGRAGAELNLVSLLALIFASSFGSELLSNPALVQVSVHQTSGRSSWNDCIKYSDSDMCVTFLAS